MEFVTHDCLRFPIKFIDGRPYAQDAGGKYHVITAYDSWFPKPKIFRVYIDGIAFHGKIRVTAGRRRASRFVSEDHGYLYVIKRAMICRYVFTYGDGLSYRVGAIHEVDSDEFGTVSLRVRLDPAEPTQ